MGGLQPPSPPGPYAYDSWSPFHEVSSQMFGETKDLDPQVAGEPLWYKHDQGQMLFRPSRNQDRRTRDRGL